MSWNTNFAPLIEMSPVLPLDRLVQNIRADVFPNFRCRKLPRSHLFLLGFLMHHLHRVAADHESNNMTASNLAIVFGPTLLRRNEDTASLITVMETIHQARAVELLTIYVEVRTRVFRKC